MRRCGYAVVTSLVGLVPNEGDNHAVQVEEEHDQMEAKLDEGFLLQKSVNAQLFYRKVLLVNSNIALRRIFQLHR